MPDKHLDSVGDNMREFQHLQILHDKEVERKLHDILPQMESWLLGAIPLNDNETEPKDAGVVFPDVGNLDAALAPIRRLIYKGAAEYALLRTVTTTNTPLNLSHAVYTVLRADGTPKIGGVPLRLTESIWIDRPVTVDAGFIFMICKPAEILVGRDIYT
ncbi:hypothetical protein TSTA_009400 [Talaromyces stipitatus ATCC 10500]|uniref:Uncharacterized protein n=1 Tax=Talaromyces stipitatus (strain ATCC 10500 / CBS 375.48 / QM 6759 / NRRL 1006) TaxID=441959 RepID=B8MFV1_TALSN|nr:uncharacterized protein TSTA_009400 [Talaromyces stipitatus ATCC 10500]EED15818.1 hypothetical protein TSTA_009400 [Talaromyces stipitatus ATCC 10500]